MAEKKFTKEQMDEYEEKLSTAVICDILDDLGYRNQAMKGNLYPLDENYKLIGHAKTILAYDVYERPAEAYKTEIAAIDSIGEGDVAVCAASTKSNGFWGELLTTVAIKRGGRGAVVDGAIRDIRQIREMEKDFKVFTGGRNPLDSKGRCLVAAYDCPIECDGVIVNPGDIIFGDIDGLVVVPLSIMEDVFKRALEKISSENIVRKELLKGRLLKDVFAEYQIL
jgi:regulator of RNase E activity RraA